MRQHHLRTLVRDASIICLVLIFAMGTSHLAKNALMLGAPIRQLVEFIAYCAILATPLTLFRVFGGVKPHKPDDGDDLIITLIVCALIAYLSFVLMGSVFGFYGDAI